MTAAVSFESPHCLALTPELAYLNVRDSAMTQRLVLESLQRQYLWLECHFNELFGLTVDCREKDVLRAAYLGSRTNLLEARSRTFMEDDPTTLLLYEDLLRNQEQIELQAATGTGGGIVTLLTVGVGLGSRLSGCGMKSGNPHSME